MSEYINRIVDDAMRKAADQIQKITSKQDSLERALKTQMSIFRDAANHLYRDDPEGFAKLIDDNYLNKPETSIPNINRSRDAKRKALGLDKPSERDINEHLKALPEDQIMVQRIDDNHVAVSAYEHLGYRHWVKVKVKGKNKPSDTLRKNLTVEQVMEEAGIKWWLDASRAYADAEQKQRDDKLIRTLAVLVATAVPTLYIDDDDSRFWKRVRILLDTIEKA